MIQLSIRADLSGLEDIENNLPSNVTQATRMMADDAVHIAKANMSTPYPPSGDVGDYPAMRTGNLRDSVQVSGQGRLPSGRFTYGTTITADTPYAVYVEKGTSRMGARPYLAPSLMEVANQFGVAFDRSEVFKTRKNVGVNGKIIR